VELFACSDLNLPFDQIEAVIISVTGARPEAACHLMNKTPPPIDEELDGSRADVADGFRGRTRPCSSRRGASVMPGAGASSSTF